MISQKPGNLCQAFVMVLFRLKVGVRLHRIEAGAVAVVTEVAMAYDQGTGVTLVEIFEQQSHALLLLCRTRVGGLTSNVEPPFVADAYRMGVVVQTVGTDHPFRPTGLDLSVTTDHVVVADAKLIMAVFAVPGINLSGRRCLVGLYCRTMNDYQCNNSHTCALLDGTRHCSQCCQDRRSDRHDDLHKKLCRLFLTHFILLSLILFNYWGQSLRLTVPKLKLIAGLIVFRIGRCRDNTATIIYGP